MKREELIAALNRIGPETGSLCCPGCGYEHGCSVHGCAVIRAAVAELEAMQALSYLPLTLAELREMDGEPVWISGEGIGCYDVCCGISLDGIVQFYKPSLPADSYGKTWLAYRRKPETQHKA